MNQQDDRDLVWFVQSGEALLGMRAQLDCMEQQLRERAGLMEAQKGTIKLIEGELQRSMDAEYTLRKENRKLKVCYIAHCFLCRVLCSALHPVCPSDSISQHMIAQSSVCSAYI